MLFNKLFSLSLLVAFLIFTVPIFANTAQPTVITPVNCQKTYDIAGDVFAEYWEKITGEKLNLQQYSDTLPPGLLVVIGSDAVNPVSHQLIQAGAIKKFDIRYDTDDYQILSANHNGRSYLIFAGASPRSTIYAVYDFFRKYANVEYFWDGDVIPQKKSIDISKINYSQYPRFQYRGIRYFAHRGLHRFRAEQWSFEEWKREIDWIMKKRFNIFMLRTGIDDLFQRAFPGQVPYPPLDALDPDGIPRSHKQRTSPWPLKFRGDLRKKVLAYAFDRGLLHPADCGTITHWYSHTPSSFFKAYPDPCILKQKVVVNRVVQRHTEAIDILEKPFTWQIYWKLTQTIIDQFGPQQARIFHTIGLAERLFGDNREQNLQLKLYTLRKTQQILREHYPDAPLLIASWDFIYWWPDDEVRQLLAELNPEKTIILDYTCDFVSRKPYKEWTYKRFPWIFGMLHAFAGNTEIRGDYNLIHERLTEAVDDDMCKGFVLWPEIAHSDTFVLEYVADNSWNPEKSSPNYAVKRYCNTRYPSKIADDMISIWQRFLTISQTSRWGRLRRDIKFHTHNTPGYGSLQVPTFSSLNEEKIEYFKKEVKRFLPPLVAAPAILKNLAEMSADNYPDPFWRRDTIDIARTILDKAFCTTRINLIIEMQAWKNGEKNNNRIFVLEDQVLALISTLADILAQSEDFSLYQSFEKLKETAPVNPFTEQVLKANTENKYCRHHVYEMVRHLYPKELTAYIEWVNKRLAKGDRSDWKKPAEFEETEKMLRDEYYNRPLSEMAPNEPRSADDLAKTLNNAAELLENILISCHEKNRRPGNLDS